MKAAEDLSIRLVNLTRDTAAMALRDAADYLDHFDLQKAHLKILFGQQRMKELKAEMDGQARIVKSRDRRTAPPPSRKADGAKCPKCSFVAKNLHGLDTHIGHKHKIDGPAVTE